MALAECAAGTQWSPEAVSSRHFLLLFLSFEVFQSYKCGGGGGGERDASRPGFNLTLAAVF